VFCQIRAGNRDHPTAATSSHFGSRVLSATAVVFGVLVFSFGRDPFFFLARPSASRAPTRVASLISPAIVNIHGVAGGSADGQLVVTRGRPGGAGFDQRTRDSGRGVSLGGSGQNKDGHNVTA
jgi:hypothetical protein